MKPTLLEVVQIIASSMDGDEVNSIHDTTESSSITKIVKTTYYDIASRGRLTRDKGIFQLTPSNDPLRPVTMYLPDNIVDLEWVKYNGSSVAEPEPRFQDVKPLPLEDFLSIILNLNINDPDVFSYTENVTGNPITLFAKNVGPPRYYTTIDDRTLIFDCYDPAVDNTLQAVKTLCFGEKTFPWSEEDTFVLPLDDKQFSLLINEAKSWAFAELKQTTHGKAEKSARQFWIDQQSAKTKIPLVKAQQRGPNYGRK